MSEVAFLLLTSLGTAGKKRMKQAVEEQLVQEQKELVVGVQIVEDSCRQQMKALH